MREKKEKEGVVEERGEEGKGGRKGEKERKEKR